MRPHPFAALLMAALLALCAGSALAGNPRAALRAVESSMQLQGWIHLTAEGRVEQVELDSAGLVPEGVAGFVRSTAQRWRFAPVHDADGAAVPVRAPLSLRVIARKLAKDQFELSLGSVAFSRYDQDDPSSLAVLRNQPPRYPRELIRPGVGGDTYMAVKVGRDGQVEDIATRQVNLNVAGSAKKMERWRQQLAAASAAAIRAWAFRVPTEGPEADAPYWIALVPVGYRVSGPAPASAEVQEGPAWNNYVRGPLEPLPWIDPSDARNALRPDSLADGGAYLLPRGGGLQPLTPLEER